MPTANPAAEDCAGDAPVADTGSNVGRSSGDADNGVDEAEAGGSSDSGRPRSITFAASAVTAVLVQRTAGKRSEEEWMANLSCGLDCAWLSELRAICSEESALVSWVSTFSVSALGRVSWLKLKLRTPVRPKRRAGLARVTVPVRVAPWGTASV